MSILGLKKNNLIKHKKFNSDLYEDNQDEIDLLATKLKIDIFEKEQKAKDFNILENKYNKIKKEIDFIIKEKKRLKNDSYKNINEGKILINKIRLENENLKEQINNKNEKNKKLYEDNNNLYQILEDETLKNTNYNSKIIEQKKILQELKKDRKELKNSNYSLNNINKKQEKEIENLKKEIDILEDKSVKINSSLKEKDNLNKEIIINLKNEKNKNEILISKLKKNELILDKLIKELSESKYNLSQLQIKLEELKYEYDKVKNKTIKLKNDYIKENSEKIEADNKNKILYEIIREDKEKIKKIKMENNILKKNNDDLKNIRDDLKNKIDTYKNNNMIEQNNIIYKELENILNIDEHIIYKVKWVENLKKIKEENHNIINGSLDRLRNHIIKYGNFGKKYDIINNDFKGNIRKHKSRNDIINIVKKYNSYENENMYDKINKPYQFFDSMIYLKGYNKINRNTANIKKEKEQKMNSNE